MTPIRKQFKPGSTFMFDIAYRDTKSMQTELPDHFHHWYEIVYVHSGKGTFFIDQTLYDMKQGDLFLIPGDTIHRALPDTVNPVTSTALFFSPLLIPQMSFGDSFSLLRAFELSKRQKRYQYDTADDRTVIESRIERIQGELSAKMPGFRHGVLLELQHMLLELTRRIARSEPSEGGIAAHTPPWMDDVLLFIEDNLFTDIQLPRLAREASVSASHFSRVFKQLTGMNVTEYVLTKRILHAKELLVGTDGKISDIAAHCGFESLPYFHKKFKAITGATPSRFRRQAVNGEPEE